MGRICVDGVRGSVAEDRSRSSSRFSFPLDLFHVFLFFLMNWGENFWVSRVFQNMPNMLGLEHEQPAECG